MVRKNNYLKGLKFTGLEGLDITDKILYFVFLFLIESISTNENMALQTEQKLRFSVSFSCFITFVFICVSIGGNAWLEKKVDNSQRFLGSVYYNKGLWKSCSKTNCLTSRRVDTSMKACQALIILACVMSLVALLLSIIEVILDRMFLYLISAATLLCFLFMLSSIAVFTNYSQDDKFKSFTFGWTYIVSWFSVIISFATFIFTFFVERFLLAHDERSAGGLTFGWKPVSESSSSYVIGL